jgi:type III pantothenate kinase
MIYTPRPYDPDAPAIVIDIGNTSIKIGTWQKRELKTPLTALTGSAEAFQDAFDAHSRAMKAGGPAAAIISSVVPAALERVRDQISEVMDQEPLVIGERIPLPIEVGVDDPRAIGIDRVCGAAAAFDTLQQACTIVSFGTAVTVDLVDDAGTLIGGAILPGVRLQLQSLHQHTAALPQVEPAVPQLPYGRNTQEAMQNGVCRGIAGAVRGLVEAYATHLNRWPHVVATGGDVELLAPLCDYIDTTAANLALRGVGIAYSKFLAEMGA